MNKRLEIILETISNIFEQRNIVTGTKAVRIAAKGNKKGRLPSAAEIEEMRKKAREERKIRRLETAERKPNPED